MGGRDDLGLFWSRWSGACLKVLGLWYFKLALSGQLMPSSLCTSMFQRLLGSVAFTLYLHPLKALAKLSMVGQRGQPLRWMPGCGSGLAWLSSCSNMPRRLGKATAGQRLLSLIHHPLQCRWLHDCCPAQGNVAHDPGARPRENVPYWKHMGNTAPQSQSLCVLLLFGKDHVKCLTKVFKQSFSFLVICVGKEG